MNEYDSGRMAGVLAATKNYLLTTSEEDAEFIIVNTCSVREHAENREYSYIGRHIKEKKIIVAGCMAQNLKEEIVQSFPKVFAVVGTFNFANIDAIIGKKQKQKLFVNEAPDSYNIDPIRGGGTAERTFQMSRQLAKAGVDCTILTLDLGLTATRQQELGQAKLIALPCFNRRFYLPLVSWGRIRSVVAEADIIHLMGHWTALNGIVYLAARSLKKPYVVCPAGALPIFGRSRILKRLYNWIGGKRLVVNADLCIAITSDEKNQLHDYGVKDGKISVIPNGISPEDYSSQDDAGFRARYGLGDAPFILFVGRLNRIKGPDLLLQAFCEAKEALRDFQLVFAGPDEGLLAELKGMVAAHGLDARVHFLGYLGGSEKSQAYHATEFLAIPSRQEAMSIVVLEAGIVGTPVLLTDQCGLNEIADVGGGRVVSPSVGALSKGLIELCAERDGLEAMGKKLQGYVMKRFLWDSVVNAYIELYEGMLRRHDPAQSAH